MKTLIPVLALAVCITACEDDPQGPTAEDLRVQDSTLTHDVMAAWGDSFRVTVEEPQLQDSAPVAPTVPKARVVAPPAPAATIPQRARVFPLTPAPIPRQRAVASVTKIERPRERDATPPRSLSIRKGSQLSLVTNGRVCSSRVGETFRATLLSPVSTSAGTIPSGAGATGVVTSSNQWGAGIGVRITSIHSNGATFPVSSRVTYIVPENSGGGSCIPTRAHIDTEVRG
jgi:hypothetical protein